MTRRFPFFVLRIWGLPFLYIYQMRNALLVGTNQSKFLVYGTLAETSVNVLLDYGLIFGHFGLPMLGFNGAAVSSICAEAAGLFVVYGVINARGIGRDLQLYHHWRPDSRVAQLILKAVLTAGLTICRLDRRLEFLSIC